MGGGLMRLIMQESNGLPNLRMSAEECLEMAEKMITAIKSNKRTNNFSVQDMPLILVEGAVYIPSSLILTLVPEGKD